MAKLVLKNCHVTVGSDISGDGADVSLDVEVDVQDATTFSASGWRSFLPGLKGWSGSVTVMQDFAASDVDSILWALMGTTATFTFRPDATGVGAGNPNYTGTVIIESYSPVGQGVGDVAQGSVSFRGTDALSRATS